MHSKVFLKVERCFWTVYMQAKVEQLHGFGYVPHKLENDAVHHLSETRDAPLFIYK